MQALMGLLPVMPVVHAQGLTAQEKAMNKILDSVSRQGLAYCSLDTALQDGTMNGVMAAMVLVSS